jgi:hypothetical protein
MGWPGRRREHDSDASTTLWVRRLLWAILLACAGGGIFYLVRAIWRFSRLLHHTYTTAGVFWPLG